MVEAVVMGRCGVDLYPTEPGRSLSHVQNFGSGLGGTAANVAVASARLGVAAALVSGVGVDPWGEFVRARLEDAGVDTTWVHPMPGTVTPVTMCEMFPPDRFPLYFYRVPPVPDEQLDHSCIPWDHLATASVTWLTGTALARPRLRTLLHEVARTWTDGSTEGRHLVLDLDFRPMLWDAGEDPAEALRDFLQWPTVVVGNSEECEVATGYGEPVRAAEALLNRGAQVVVVKRGDQGVYARTSSEEVELPGIPVDVVNGLGAGDAFGGVLVAGLVRGWPLALTLSRANAAGALVASHLMCASAMPSLAQIDSLLELKGFA